ncbi:MAG: UxaA family hydrolase [Candidatus Helarchaeota archaeon]|nr:UxaA family hydrolase [Candidatus Helarchaeota archaeon]
MEFKGFDREDGSVGVRNYVIVLPTVVCSNQVAINIERKVEGVIALPHQFGCGHVENDYQHFLRSISGLGKNPNVHSVLIVGLGCESISAEALTKEIEKTHKKVEFLNIQDQGTIKTTEMGIKIAKEMLIESQKEKQKLFDLSNLILGTECGGSDPTSGIAANPAVGVVADMIVEAGGTVILPEFIEWIGTEHILAKRAINEEVSKKIIEPIKVFLNTAKEMGYDFKKISLMAPGNIKGGLSTIEEKSLGTICKGGKSPIQDVLKYAESPPGKGLYLMFEPGLDVESMTGMAASGAQIIVFTTGRGSPTGNPVCPVIRVTGNPQTYEKMRDNIDIDASTIITKGTSIETVGKQIFDEIIDVANGKLTIAEKLGHHELAFFRPPFTGFMPGLQQQVSQFF